MGAAGQPHGSAAHRAGFAAVATLAGAVVLVLVASGSFAQRAEVLLQDDVTHDGAIGDLFNGHGRVPRGQSGQSSQSSFGLAARAIRGDRLWPPGR